MEIWKCKNTNKGNQIKICIIYIKYAGINNTAGITH